MKTPPALFTALGLLIACASSPAAENWKPLWDGKTFDGWHVIGKGEWIISDGAIRGTHARAEKELKDDPGRREDRFALQVHAGLDCEVWFKDIEIQVE